MTPIEERTVGSLMSTPLLAVAPGESSLMAWELMQEGRCRHLPVIDSTGHCTAVLTAEALARRWSSGGPDTARRPVGDLPGSVPPPEVRPEDPVSAAAEEMLQAGTDFAAIIDDQGRLAGLLTATDLIAALAGRPAPRNTSVRATPTLFRLEPVLPRARHPGRSTIEPD